VSITARDREEIKLLVLATMREIYMGERDAHLRSATAIERAYGIRPLTSQLRTQFKENVRRGAPLYPPLGVVEFIQKHEALGNVVTTTEHHIVASDCKTGNPVAKMECRDIGKTAFALMREMWLDPE